MEIIKTNNTIWSTEATRINENFAELSIKVEKSVDSTTSEEMTEIYFEIV